MSVSHPIAQEPVDQPSKRETETQLHGYKLILVRTAWVIIAVTALALSLLDIPHGYIQYLFVCTQNFCPNQEATPELVKSLHSAGLSIEFYALYLTVLTYTLMAIFCIIALLIVWHKSRNWLGLLVSLTLILIGTVGFTNSDYPYLAETYHLTPVPGDLLNILLRTLPILVGYLFPDGRFVPRWTRWLALVIVFFIVAGTLFPSTLFNSDNWPNPLSAAAQYIPFATLLFAQVYRYLRVSSPVQKQQTKWVVLGIITTAVYLVVLAVAAHLNPAITQAQSLGIVLAEGTYYVVFIIIPLSIAFSILRYRLWEIDLLINRTLVYVLLTAILGLIYFGSVVLLQRLVNGLTGQAGQSPVVIVISTLAIAALFHPLRRRIQSIIDRRFYRRKYDAARTLAAFSATLRNEVDLNELHEHLIAAVQETMQPAHISLWLRPPVSPSLHQAPWRATPADPSKGEAKEEW